MDPRSKKLLLSLLGVLVVVKFLIVPWLEHLAIEREELTTLTKKLTRSQSLLQVREQVESNEKLLQETQQALLAELPEATEQAAYRIQFQQHLQTLLDGFGVQLMLFEWLSDESLKSLSVQRGRVSFRLKGSVAQVARVHLAMEQQMPYLQIRELRASWPGALQQGKEIELAVIVDIEYKVAAP